MSSRTAGAARGARDIRWRAVAFGWIVAVLTGIVISPVLRLLYDFFAEPPVERGELTVALVVISVLSGFLSYIVGGFVAAKMARFSGGKHGALTAVFGLILGIILAIVLALFGIIFAEGVAVPPVSFGLTGAAVVAGLLLFMANLFGGFVGGKLGEPSRLDF